MRFIVSIIVFCIVCCCRSSDKEDQRKQAEALVSQWHGKEIRMVEDLPCRIFGNDTLAGDIYTRPCKLLVYVDSAGCTACRLQLAGWRSFLAEMQPICTQVSVLFVFQIQDRDLLAELFIRYGIRYPYFQDKDDAFMRVNKFPEDMSTRVFLLDDDNRVVLVGNPVGNTRMWLLYRGQISAMLDLQEDEWPEKGVATN